MEIQNVMVVLNAITLEQHLPSLSVMLTVALSGDPLIAPKAAANGGISTSRKNSSGHSATSSSVMDTFTLTVVHRAGKVTGMLSFL